MSYHDDKNKEAGRKLAERAANKQEATRIGASNGGWAGVIFIWLCIAVIGFFAILLCVSVYGLWLKYFWHGFIGM